MIEFNVVAAGLDKGVAVPRQNLETQHDKEITSPGTCVPNLREIQISLTSAIEQ
jgi:hypothetical protein